MKRLILAATALGALALTAATASAQRYHRGHTSVTIGIGTGYSPFYGGYYGPSYGYWRPYWRYSGRGFGWRTWDPFFGDPFFGDRLDVRTVDKFEASAEIVTHKGAKPADDPRAFDARAVVDNLKPRIQYPAPPK